MSPRVEIDPDGDVLLCLFQTQSLEGTTDENTGGKKKRIRELVVSSKVLSLASPVFKAMFCGNFKESIELAVKKTSLEPTSLEPYGISLPEDDADATTILCRVLHYKIDEIPEKPTTICLEKLAFLSDKYQCVNALMYSGSLWLRNWLRVHETKKMSMDDLCRLLIFAYVIDLPYEFVCISWEIFLAHKGSLLGPSTQVVVLLDHPLLHEDIAREINEKRFEFCKYFHGCIMGPMNHEYKPSNADCHRARNAVFSYINSLREGSIFPYDLEFTEHRFSDLLTSALQLRPTSLSSCRSGAYCKCTTDPVLSTSLNDDIRNAANSIKKLQNSFICLDCVKAKGKTGVENKCRIAHF